MNAFLHAVGLHAKSDRGRRAAVTACLVCLTLFGALPVEAQTPASDASIDDAIIGTGTPDSCTGDGPANALDAAVSAGGMITFDCGPDPFTFVANTMVVTSNTTIDGGDLITLSGEALRQLFVVDAGASLVLTNITLASGANFGGGGAIRNAGTLTIRESTLRDSTASGVGVDAYGGAILNAGGTLTIETSTLQSNVSSEGGGALGIQGGSVAIRSSTFNGNYSEGPGGAIYIESGALAVANSTFSANSSASTGGALFDGIDTGDGAIAIDYSTFYLNSGSGGGTFATQEGDAEPVRVTASILYASPGNQLNCFIGSNDSVLSGDYNMASDDSCGLAGSQDVQNVVDPKLGGLADNGGRTMTHLPLVGSPAVDKIPANLCGLNVDQRGKGRPQAPTCDKGSVEEVPTVMPPLPINQPTAAPFYLNKILIRPFDWPVFVLKPNIEATRLEVTQAVQEEDGTGVTLIAGKRTYVRFHVRKTSGNPDPVVGARLWRIVNGARFGDPLLPSHRLGVMRLSPYLLGSNNYVFDPVVTVVASPDRNRLGDSFYFALPIEWTAAGNLTVEAEVNPTFLTNPLDESTRADNILRTTVSFVTTPRMILRLFSVRYKVNNVVYTPTETQLKEAEDWLRRAYPIHRLTVIRDVEDMTNLNRLPTCDDVNGRLFWDNLFLKWANIDLVPTRYYGMVSDADGARFMRGCAADIPGFIASGPTGDPADFTNFTWDSNNDGVSYGDWYMGHEVGHTWGRKHVNCSGTELGVDTAYPQQGGTIGRKNNANTHWGFDIAIKGPVVYPPTWTDIMSYCSNQWISAYTYEAIRNRLVSENEALQAASPNQPLADYLIVQGSVTPGGSSATIDEAYRLTAPNVVGPPIPGDYSIRLLDASNNVLSTTAFTPRSNTDDLEGMATSQLIVEQVPWATGTRLIQILHDATVLASRAVSQNAPTVTVTAPAPGTVVGDPGLAVAWSASDADGDPLDATVLFSRDNGATWLPLRLHITGNSVVVPASELGGTSQGKVRVIVNDGVNTGQDDSEGTITTPNLPPTAQILSPGSSMTVGYGTVLALSGSANDPEDAEVPPAAMTWSSDLDGVLGAGPDIETQLETIGVHTVTFHAEDSLGAGVDVTRIVTVTDDALVTAASMSATPNSTSASAVLGSTTVQKQNISLRNPASGVLAWQASSNVPWLTLAPALGQTPAEPELSINPAGLPVGQHKGVITVSASAQATTTQAAGALPTQTVMVFLTVEGKRVLLPTVRR